MLTPDMIAKEFQTPNLSVRYYHRDSANVVVVFASAGAVRKKGFAEEYIGSLSENDCSVVFVTDRNIRWYNYGDTDTVFKEVAAIASGYDHVAAIGESLGGSGAILFSNFCTTIDRVLAFTPQYSIARPFIEFDKRYSSYAELINRFYYGTFEDSPVKEKCVLVYGNTSWRDFLHQSMFERAGFKTLTVDLAPHEVSANLRSRPGLKTHLLAEVVRVLCDFTAPLSTSRLEQVPAGWSGTKLREEDGFNSFVKNRIDVEALKRKTITLAEPGFPNISNGKPASQSSVSRRSKSRSAEEDAAKGLNGVFGPDFNFHTRIELAPWWRVDLLERHAIQEIRIFNRIDNSEMASRAYRFLVAVSDDDVTWRTILTKDDAVHFGGVDGRPYQLFVDGLSARYVMVRLLRHTALHLSQVQVFGTLRWEALLFFEKGCIRSKKLLRI